METNGLNMLSILSKDDNEKVPENIRQIIKTELHKKEEELFIAKKLVVSTKNLYDKQILELNENLKTTSDEQKNDKNVLKKYSEDLDDLRNRIQASETEINNLRTNVQRLEEENDNLRKQRNSFGDERDDLMKIVQRRDNEIQRYQDDVSNLTNQLDAISKSKCEALIKVEECESKQMSLEFKEKRLEQERELFTKQIQSLNNELNEQKSELLLFRKNNTRDKVDLETKLYEKSEELENYKQQMENLKTQNNNMAKTNEDLLNRLQEEHENSLKIKDYFDQEINAQTKVANLYKEMTENSDSKTSELTNAIKELQKLLTEASQQYGELESKTTTDIEKLKEDVSGRDNLIKNLRTELCNANDLLKAAKEENLEQTLEGLSPTAAAVSRLVKSGMTLTQIYTEYAKVSEELVLEKNENKNLKLYIETILQEIEEKAPLLKQLNEDFHTSQENLRLLAHQVDDRDNEAIRLREEHSQAITKSKQLERDNARFKQEITDMGRQICFLLNEVEVSRAGFTQPPKPSLDNSDLHNSSDVITRHLVEFRDIQELQEKNRMLTSLVRELSNKEEKYDSNNQQTEKMDTSQAEKVENLQEEIKELQDKLNRHQKMIETALNQRDMYKKLYEQDSSSVNLARSRTPVNKSKTELTPITPSGDIQNIKNELKMALSKLETSEKSLTEMRTEFEQYRQIRVENEKHLHEQLEKMRDECRELTKKNCRLASQNEFSEQQHKILKNNLEAYKKQIASLEEKARVYNEIIIKHESSISLLKEETLSSQHKAARQEVETSNLKEECSLLRQNESRLLREMENVRRERSSQNILMANLETIKASIERVNCEGQMRLENRLEENSREYGVLQRKLKEMEQNHNDVIQQINREMKKAKDHLEEEKRLRLQAQQEVQFSRDAIQQRDDQLLSLSAKVRSLETQTTAPTSSGNNSSETQKITELTQKLKTTQAELESVRALLATEKRHSSSYNEIATGLETQHKELQGRLDKETKESANKLAEQTKISKEYQLRIETLEETIAKATVGSDLNASELNRQLEETKLKLEETLSNFENLKSAHETSQEMLQSVSEAMQATDEKYNREVILHSQNIQALSALKEEANKFKDELLKTKEVLKTAQSDLEMGRKGWTELEALLKKEKEQTLEQIQELQSQNNILHDQIEALGAKLSIVHQQNSSDLNVSAETAAILEDITSHDEKGSKQLLRLVKYLRKEKDISLSKYEMIRTENARLKAQLEMIQQQLDESKETLSNERQTSDSNLLSSTKQSELLRKLETLNAITDSNRVLREERNSLSESIKGMAEQITKLNTELEPLRKINIEQTTRLEALEAENSALRTEAARLHQNIQTLIERSNKHSPADWRLLNTERETLSRQLTIERDNTNKQREEMRILRGRVNTLEAQLAQSQKQNSTLHEELTQLKNELTNTKAIVEQSQKDTKTKEDAFNDLRTKELNIRKIARKYKNQFEELTKKMEDDKSKMEAEAAAAAAAASQPVEIPSEKIEQLREEGRQEAEAKLKEAVERHSDQVKGLNKQIKSYHDETEFLKRENERAKAIVKSARVKIIQLTEVNKNITQDLTETQAKVNNEQDERSQLEARIGQLEKELSESRGERESMQQRIKLLQGMLEKQQHQQVAKPSTSSGPVSASGGGQGAGGGGAPKQGNTDKAAHPNEPPTANIKPIPGPSNSAAIKQQQQSVTISRPSRVDTPFASIRPMTIPTRTVAVMPSSQTPSTGVAATSGTQSVQVQPSPSTSAIVTPQQCAVHTTGSSTGERPTSEILAASPTSSINDYVPPSTSASSSSASTGVSVGVSSGTPSTSTSTSQPASHSRTPSVTVHPTKLQQQPAQTMSVPQGSPQQQQAQPQHSQGQQGAESTQDFEPEPMEVAPQQVPTVSQPSTSSGTNVASVVVASASSQQQSSNLGQLTAVAMVMPRMEGQPQQQAIGQTTAPNAPGNSESESSKQQPQPGSSGQTQQESEQQPGPSDPQPGPSSVVCSQASSSSSTVTTTQQAAKRARQEEEEEEEDNSPTSMPGDDNKNPQSKRLRLGPTPGPSSRELFSEVEYQVPTSSQRDHEDEVIVLHSGDEGEEDDENLADEGLPEEPDDGPEFEDDNDNYDLETYDRDEPEAYDEGPDIDSETDANNEAENINADSDEVPNPSGSGVQSVGSGGHADGGTEATSSDNTGPEQGNARNDDNGEEESGADNSNVPGPSLVSPALSRSRTLTSLSRQQQQLVLPGSYDECTDDSIVPSTPTLYVPRRMDAFGEAVSSPQVPQRRFTFTDAHQQPSHSQSHGCPSGTSGHGNVEGSESREAGSSVGITGSGNSSSAGTPLGRAEGIIEDTRIDLSQLEESGTGRSVPSTPLQVSPQGESADGVEREAAQSSIPSITITEASGNVTAATGTDDDMVDDASTQDLETLASPDGQTASTEAEAEALEEEQGDGVTSEGEKPVVPSDSSTADNPNDGGPRTEESREAEAMVEGMMTRSRRGSPQTARRSGGNPRSGPYSRGGRGLSRPTPIIWSEPGSSQPSSGFGGRGGPPPGGNPGIRGTPAQPMMMRGGHVRAGRRMRKPINLFNNFQRF